MIKRFIYMLKMLVFAAIIAASLSACGQAKQERAELPMFSAEEAALEDTGFVEESMEEAAEEEIIHENKFIGEWSAGEELYPVCIFGEGGAFEYIGGEGELARKGNYSFEGEKGAVIIGEDAFSVLVSGDELRIIGEDGSELLLGAEKSAEYVIYEKENGRKTIKSFALGMELSCPAEMEILKKLENALLVFAGEGSYAAASEITEEYAKADIADSEFMQGYIDGFVKELYPQIYGRKAGEISDFRFTENPGDDIFCFSSCKTGKHELMCYFIKDEEQGRILALVCMAPRGEQRKLTKLYEINLKAISKYSDS